MSSVANLQPEPAAIRACTVSRDVQNFELLIDDMEIELGEAWGDLSFEDAAAFLDQPDATDLEFLALAVDAEDEAHLGEISNLIRQAKAREIKVLIIAEKIGPAALHRLMRLGADDFLPYPLPEGVLHDTLERIRNGLPAPGFQEPDTAHPGFKAKGDRDGVVLPIHGLSGASTLAANLAWELATIPGEAPRVCLIDLDFQFGSAATYLDLPRKEAVFDFLSDALLQAMLTFNGRLHILTAPYDMLPLDMLGPDEIGRILDMARAKFDFFLIDMPKTIVSWTEAVLSRAHLYFALIELDLRSAQNVLRLVRALRTEGLPHEKLRYVLNRAPKFTDLSAKSRVKRMAESLEIAMELQLPDGGAQVKNANDHGLPLAETAAKTPLRREIQKLAKSFYELNKSVETARR
jgi:pilus assembly protein CpaE